MKRPDGRFIVLFYLFVIVQRLRHCTITIPPYQRNLLAAKSAL